MQGNEINMAARLMSKATPGQILVSQRVAERAARHFRFNALGAIELKGSIEPVPIAEVANQLPAAGIAPGRLYASPLVGREGLMAELEDRLRSAQAGHGCIIRLEGPAGIGKSHLAAAFCRQAIALGWQVATGVSQSTTEGMAYYPWRQVFRTLFDLSFEELEASQSELETDGEPPKLDTVVEKLAASLNSLHVEWQPRLPLLGDLLGLPIPDNAITTNLDPRLRREALFDLAMDVIQALADRQPLLLVLEDMEWIDEISIELATAIARAIGGSRVTLLFLHRPPLQRGSPPPAPAISDLPHHFAVQLAELDPDSVAALAQRQLQGPLAPLALTLIQLKSQGNPFFVEELVAALREAGSLELQPDGRWQLAASILDLLRTAACLTRVNGEWALIKSARLEAANLGIPDTVQDLVQSRIDRLPEESKLTLRVASVIGHTFEIGLLQAAHPASPQLDELEQQIESMAGHDFVQLESSVPQPTYMFRHNITHEVAYETLLFSQRRPLHRAVAEWYEGSFSDAPLDLLAPDSPLAPYYPLLVHHWHRAEDWGRERVYAVSRVTRRPSSTPISRRSLTSAVHWN